MIIVTATAKVLQSSKKINLEKWFFNLTPEDYQKSSPSNLSLNFGKNSEGKKTFTNKVRFAGHLLINHYMEVESTSNHLRLVSQNSTIFLFQLIPVSIKVSYDLAIDSISENESQLICTSTGEYPPLLEILSNLTFAKYFLQKHQNEETAYFAKMLNS